jgi:flagellar basal-body rod modification protein FlgD
MATSTNPINGTGSSSPSSSNSSGLPAQQITETDFMTLLSAELQGQDPTTPVDPTTFVTQLAQFVVLDQVTQINSLLQSYLGGSSSDPGTEGTPSTGS